MNLPQREIKFKVWDYNTKDWHVWRSADDIFGIHSGSRTIRFNRGDMVACEFTGLKDKNGKEIWEGDIISRDGYKSVIVYRTERMKYVAKEIDNNPKIINDQRQYLDEVEVIGNIYENPELLS